MSEGDGAAQAAERDITLQAKVDIQHRRDADGRPRRGMQGFEPRYADFVDYIIGITHEIWEEKGIGKLYKYYANTARVHMSDGTLYGREAVLAATLGTLAAYPDRRLYGDEVIWDGDDERGYYSSHRLVHSGTNRGWSLYGAPTHNKVRYYAVADCVCRRNMVVEEWLVRDELTLVHQLGLEPVATAREIAQREAQGNPAGQPEGDIERGVGQLPPPTLPAPAEGAFDAEAFARRALHDIWNWRLLNKVREYYAETLRAEGPSLRRIQGHNDYQVFALALLAPFPDLAISVERSTHVGNATEGWRVALRWRMTGTHTGYGIYGEPTGRRIHILGVNHLLIHGERIQQEWMLFDEFSLLKQLHRPQA